MHRFILQHQGRVEQPLPQNQCPSANILVAHLIHLQTPNRVTKLRSLRGQKIRGKWVVCHSGGFAYSNKRSFSFGELYIKRLIIWTPLSILQSNFFLLPTFPAFFVWPLRSWGPELLSHLIKRRWNLFPFFQCCYYQNGGIHYLLDLFVSGLLS